MSLDAPFIRTLSPSSAPLAAATGPTLRWLRPVILPLATAGAILLLWQVGAMILRIPAVILPVPSRWFLYSAAGIRNNGQTITTQKKTLDSDPSLCEAVIGGLLEALAFTLTNPQEALDLFRQEVPEMAPNPSSKEFARIGLGMWEHGVDHPEAQAHGLGWSNPAGYAETTDLVMQYLSSPGMQRPAPDTVFTNRFTGTIRLTNAQCAGVRQRVAEFDKILS